MNATDATSRRTTAILAIILISYFMILLDNSIVFTALPTIEGAMQLSPTGLAWQSRTTRPAHAEPALPMAAAAINK